MTSSSVLIDVASVTLRDIHGLQNPELTMALRQAINTAAWEYSTAVQMQDE